MTQTANLQSHFRDGAEPEQTTDTEPRLFLVGKNGERLLSLGVKLKNLVRNLEM